MRPSPSGFAILFHSKVHGTRGRLQRTTNSNGPAHFDRDSERGSEDIGTTDHTNAHTWRKAQRRANQPTIAVPIAAHDNNQHAENDNIRIQNLWDGIEIFARLMTMDFNNS